MHNEMRSYPFDSFSAVRHLPALRERPLGEPRTQPTTTWQVRRAEAYIETHWNEPITIASLARATAASARSIFYHFKTSRGQSPMSFVKQVRLEHARKMLESSGIDRSVTEIAVDCGFGNLGHFAGDYFKRFGERPSETLKRSKYELAAQRPQAAHIGW
jgi:transcriptional regulator GlxA family with amidase domain